MADLAALEKRLNSDDTLRTQFLSDPVKVFKDAGITLTPKMAESLASSIKSVKDGTKPPAGSNILRTANDVNVGIGIGVRF